MLYLFYFDVILKRLNQFGASCSISEIVSTEQGSNWHCVDKRHYVASY